MAELENAQQALAQLQTDVDSLIAKPAGVSPAEVQALADGITALDAKVKAAL